MQRTAGGDEDGDPWGRLEQGGDHVGRAGDLLEVVEDKERATVTEEGERALRRGLLGGAHRRSHRLADAGPHDRGAVGALEWHEEDVARSPGLQRRRRGHGEAGLAGPPGAGQRDQACPLDLDRSRDGLQLRIPSQERRGIHGQVRSHPQGAKRRVGLGEPGRDDLVQVLRLGQVLEPVPAQVQDQLGRQSLGDESLGCLRDDDLTSMGGCHDPGRSVDVDPDVVVLVHLRLTSVQPDPHP